MIHLRVDCLINLLLFGICLFLHPERQVAVALLVLDVPQPRGGPVVVPPLREQIKWSPRAPLARVIAALALATWRPDTASGPPRPRLRAEIRTSCEMTILDLNRPSYHSKIQFSRQFFADVTCPSRALYLFTQT